MLGLNITPITGVPSFAINFDFSGEVQKILDSGKESLIVDIIISGQPTDRTALAGKDYYSDEDEIVYLKNLEMVCPIRLLSIGFFFT